MWTFASEARLSRTAWTAVVALLAAAFGFYWLQNHYRPVGGEISWPKLLWLMDAVLLWLVLPVLIAADPRLGAKWRRPYLALAALMLARGPIELWMLYVSLNWSPWYGIGHDLLCAGVLAAWGARLWAEGGPLARREQLALLHLAVTALMFVPEIYFAWYMQAHFNTRGDAAVYFVPDDPAYATVLRVTTAVVSFLALYLPFFMVSWLHGTPQRERPVTG